MLLSVLWPDSVAPGPRSTSAAIPPFGWAVSRRVPVRGALVALAATTAGSVRPSLARTGDAPRGMAIAAGVEAIAIVASVAKAGSAANRPTGPRPMTAADTRPSQYRLTPAPGQMSTATDAETDTDTRVAATAVAKPRRPTTRARTARAEPRRNSDISASTPSGASSTATTTLGAAPGMPKVAATVCQPPSIPSGNPSASCQAGTALLSVTTPGSANIETHAPRWPCCQTSGANSTADGRSTRMIRANRRRLSTRAITQTTRSAGISDGAQATVAAARSAVVPAAAQERAADSPA